MNHTCSAMDNHKNIKIYSLEDSNDWVMSIKIEGTCDFNHATYHKINCCPFCGTEF